MLSVIPFESHLAEPVATFWRALHPEWTWLDDPETRAKAFAPSEFFERVGYVVERGNDVIASVLGTCSRDNSSSRNRYIHIEARPEDITADWLDPLLTNFSDLDRLHPGTWQIVNPPEILWPILAPVLAGAGFIHRGSSIRMEWEGDSVTVPDPAPARFERYAGSNPDIDKAITDLHNRSYRALRLTPPTRPEFLWEPWPGLSAREYVLALEENRLVGYAEWFVTDGKPCINSFVAARSHWGTPIGEAVGLKAMQILIELGHRKIESGVFSTNAPSMKLHLKNGWRAVAEQVRTYVRAF
jgi:RimJ/RimL family protein N-acetyltransferase